MNRPGKIWLIHGVEMKEVQDTTGILVGKPAFEGAFRQEIISGKSASEALDAVIGKSPELHRAWVEAGAGPLDAKPVLVRLATFKEAVNYYVAKGNKPGKAIDIVLEKHPDLWEAYIKGGAGPI